VKRANVIRSTKYAMCSFGQSVGNDQ